MKKILFITGTRADYGKIKSLIRAVEKDNEFEAYIFVSGMHMIEKLGSTYREVLKDNYQNVYVDFSQANIGVMSYDLGNIICNLTGYVSKIKPDMIVVHGDRIDAMAGAITGALNNICVAHIEGGELSGTIDESIRHAITKLAHLHLVANEEAGKRLIQLGEEEKRIYLMGSPDIDIMLSDKLPSIEKAKERYGIEYSSYALLMYHPVTTEVNVIRKHIKEVVDTLLLDDNNYVIVYPNNDLGSEFIIREYERLENNERFKIFPSIRFEYFLSLLKNAEFMIGNSSAGIRETGVYGIPSIDIGTRQSGRFSKKNKNLQHVEEDMNEITEAIKSISDYKKITYEYGQGNSTNHFMKMLKSQSVWKLDIQKKFVDIEGI